MTSGPGISCWPPMRLGEALVELGQHSGLIHNSIATERVDPPVAIDDDSLTTWIEIVTARLGIEAKWVQPAYAECEQFLLNAGPVIVRLSTAEGPRFLAIVSGRKRWLSILGPDLVTRKVRLDLVCEAIRGSIGAEHRADIDRLLRLAGIGHSSKPQHARIRRALLNEQIGTVPINGAWLLRLSPAAPFFSQVRQFGLLKPAVGFVTVYSVQYLLGIAAWWLVGAAVLRGHLDLGWLEGWALLLLTILPLQALATWFQGVFFIGAGGLLKRRLLCGALRLEPEEVRAQGAGQMLGRVIESEAVESLALSGGLIGIMAAIEIVTAIVIMALGAGGWFQVVLFLGWMFVLLQFGRIAYRRNSAWTAARLRMTHDLIEKMVGHRTRLAQERAWQWHLDEDPALTQYLGASRAVDRSGTLIGAVVTHGWTILGVLGLAPALVSGSYSKASLAVGLGGMLLASAALQKLSMGFSSVAGASIAWSQVRSLFHAAARPEIAGTPTFAPVGHFPKEVQMPVLEVHDLAFSHGHRAGEVLNGVSLRICDGDRILLRGESGSGKSTLAALFAGLRMPDSGLILLRSLDLHTLGLRVWRKQIAIVPQFHENHLLSGSLAFNLLMGRRWPPRPDDLAEAEVICRELGLGELLDHMPAGLFQIVGQNGWQLSHGERGRVFAARALLQESELVILDESFGMLDPENFQKALRCASARANAMVVIAHP